MLETVGKLSREEISGSESWPQSMVLTVRSLSVRTVRRPLHSPLSAISRQTALTMAAPVRELFEALRFYWTPCYSVEFRRIESMKSRNHMQESK